MLHYISLINLLQPESEPPVWLQLHTDRMDPGILGAGCLVCEDGKQATQLFGGYCLCDDHLDKSDQFNDLLVRALGVQQ